MSGSIDVGRDAFARRAWDDAHAQLATAALSCADEYELLAVASYMSGHDDESAAAFERAHSLALDTDDVERAVRCGAWLAIALLLRGEYAHASGWLARVERVLANASGDVAARGLLLVPAFLGALDSGELPVADAMATEMIAIGSRLDNADVLAFGLLCHGEALAAAGDVVTGMRRLDEAMVSVTAGETGPIASGIIYCAVIEACMAVSDMRRAGEWTAALTTWCASQPGLVPYRGQCLVHRSEILLARGTWTEALAEATRARERLSDPAHPALGNACYQQGELHRLLGAYDEAELAYRAAAAHGREPAPGLALLRLAAGDVGAARAAIARVTAESGEAVARPSVLAATVEIALAAGDRDDASRAAGQLRDIASRFDAPLARAAASYATGSILLHDGDAAAALPTLRDAFATWRDIDMPYDAARARVQIAIACRSLGDHDGSEIELDAARAVFSALGANPEVARIDAVLDASSPNRAAPLTGRECEVLRLVATGMTNREIAAELVISEHTVARHLQNIFLKLDLPSRAAATAYAYEHNLV